MLREDTKGAVTFWKHSNTDLVCLADIDNAHQKNDPVKKAYDNTKGIPQGMIEYTHMYICIYAHTLDDG